MWRVGFAAAVKKFSTPRVCQDKVGGVAEKGFAALCVADGLGSCAFSHIGARCAVNHFLSCAKPMVLCKTDAERASTFLQNLDAFREIIERKAFLKKCSPESFASTLVLLIIHEGGVLGFRVGDGFVVARFEGEEKFVSLFAPMDGARDITPTLLKARESYETFSCNRVPSFAMCSSDGLYDLTHDIKASSPYQIFFRDLEAGVLECCDFSQYLKRVLRASLERDPADDKSIVVFLQK